MNAEKSIIPEPEPAFASSTYGMGDGDSSFFDEPNPKDVYKTDYSWRKRREDQLTSQSMLS